MRTLRVAFPDCSFKEALGRTKLPTLHDRREELSRPKAILLGHDEPLLRLNHLLPAKRVTSHDLRNQEFCDAVKAMAGANASKEL